jgi:hypothetical protein
MIKLKIKKGFIELADVLIIAGTLLSGVGIWQIYRPAAYIFVGLCSLVAGIIGLRR